ncbi:Ldh family oxidoreductase [Pelagibius sp.]|uniref:Ldh family oxidoreductase n=1 Tax=Pelagibius sp. TaxID=1931238 RepID=UPI0026396178|nr:Ldh family oxidoreductase [Pelagibius sp.]
MSDHPIQAERLAAFAAAAYRAMGVPEADAALLADTLVQADLWGHQSHGVMRTFWYGERLRSGAMRAVTKPEVVVDGGAVAVLDGCDGIGQVITARAMREAVDRSKRHGIGAVAVRNSGHFGTAMYFTRTATEDGCIGFLSTNASPAMAPWGGRRKLIGTNPWSIAAPAGRHPPMLLDIANTAVARGKLYLARQRGETIPEGWAIDAEGRATIDPAAGIAGNILPMAGHKGYAIAAMMDVLSGVLSGSGFGGAVVGPYVPEGRSGVGHLVMALNIEAFRPNADFAADMERLIADIKAVPRAPGVKEIHYPGELEARAEERQRRHGVVIPEDTLAELDAAARELGIATLSSLTD